ncbi:MAG: rod-binding protein [Sulfurospirillum sp.]|nr:MAG: rod-binding protein [Sulfurospirillum sp.]
MFSVDTTAALSAFEPKIDTRRDLTNENDQKLKEQTDKFEAFLLKKVLDISLKSENRLFGKDAGDKIYRSMYNDTFSQALSGDIGFSQMLFDFLKEQKNLQK